MHRATSCIGPAGRPSFTPARSACIGHAVSLDSQYELGCREYMLNSSNLNNLPQLATPGLTKLMCGAKLTHDSHRRW